MCMIYYKPLESFPIENKFNEQSLGNSNEASSMLENYKKVFSKRIEQIRQTWYIALNEVAFGHQNFQILKKNNIIVEYNDTIEKIDLLKNILIDHIVKYINYIEVIDYLLKSPTINNKWLVRIGKECKDVKPTDYSLIKISKCIEKWQNNQCHFTKVNENPFKLLNKSPSIKPEEIYDEKTSLFSTARLNPRTVASIKHQTGPKSDSLLSKQLRPNFNTVLMNRLNSGQIALPTELLDLQFVKTSFKFFNEKTQPQLSSPIKIDSIKGDSFYVCPTKICDFYFEVIENRILQLHAIQHQLESLKKSNYVLLVNNTITVEQTANSNEITHFIKSKLDQYEQIKNLISMIKETENFQQKPLAYLKYWCDGLLDDMEINESTEELLILFANWIINENRVNKKVYQIDYRLCAKKMINKTNPYLRSKKARPVVKHLSTSRPLDILEKNNPLSTINYSSVLPNEICDFYIHMIEKRIQQFKVIQVQISLLDPTIHSLFKNDELVMKNSENSNELTMRVENTLENCNAMIKILEMLKNCDEYSQNITTCLKNWCDSFRAVHKNISIPVKELRVLILHWLDNKYRVSSKISDINFTYKSIDSIDSLEKTLSMNHLDKPSKKTSPIVKHFDYLSKIDIVEQDSLPANINYLTVSPNEICNFYMQMIEKKFQQFKTIQTQISRCDVIPYALFKNDKLVTKTFKTSNDLIIHVENTLENCQAMIKALKMLKNCDEYSQNIVACLKNWCDSFNQFNKNMSIPVKKLRELLLHWLDNNYQVSSKFLDVNFTYKPINSTVSPQLVSFETTNHINSLDKSSH